MMNFLFFLSFAAAFVSLFLCTYALVRLRQIYKSLKPLDWELLGTLTGDVGSLKVAYQRLNNRIGGMTSTREKADINDIAYKAILNGQAGVAKTNKHGGG